MLEGSLSKSSKSIHIVAYPRLCTHKLYDRDFNLLDNIGGQICIYSPVPIFSRHNLRKLIIELGHDKNHSHDNCLDLFP